MCCSRTWLPSARFRSGSPAPSPTAKPRWMSSLSSAAWSSPAPSPASTTSPPVPARPCRAPASRLLRGLPIAVAIQPLGRGFDRMPWIGLDSTARTIWSEDWPSHWAPEIAAHLTMTHGLFPDVVLPTPGSASSAPPGATAPSGSSRPRGSAGVSQPLPSLWHAHASRCGRRRHCMVLVRLARVGVQPRLPPKQGTILCPRPCGRRTRPKTGSNHGPPLRRRPARRTALCWAEAGPTKLAAPLVGPRARVRASRWTAGAWYCGPARCSGSAPSPTRSSGRPRRRSSAPPFALFPGQPILFTALWVPLAIAVPMLIAWILHFTSSYRASAGANEPCRADTA